MAIAFDAGTDGGNNSGSGSLTFSHTVTGSLPILFVGFVGDTASGNDDITTVTYNGVALTLSDKDIASNVNRFAYLYWLVGPATGTHNVVISSTNNHYLIGGAVSYTGAQATGQLDAHAVNDSTPNGVSTLTGSLTTVADNAWMVTLSTGYSIVGTDPTAGTGSTYRVRDATFGAWGFFDNGPITPAGSTSMQTNRTAAANVMVHLKASIVPDTGGGGGGNPWHYYAQQRRQFRREQRDREQVIARAYHETLSRRAA